MPSVQIKNIGPLIDTGEIVQKPVTLLLGKQSTGKSTLMKILCFCRWIEKQIMIGDDKLLSQYTHYNRFFKELKQFHRFSDSSFSPDSEIIYKGDSLSIYMKGMRSNVKIERYANFKTFRCNAKLCFIPSERNLLSAIRNIDRAYKASDMDVLFNYIFEWGEAKEMFTSKEPITLSFDKNVLYYYDQVKDVDVVRLKDKQKEIAPFYASSGVQSALPIEVLVRYIVSCIGKPVAVSRKELMDVIMKHMLRETTDLKDTVEHQLLNHLLWYKYVNLFIEEPEQNLHPGSQWDLVLRLVASMKEAALKSEIASSIVMTSHSPYVLSTLNVLMKAALAYEKNKELTLQIVPDEYILKTDDIAAYYIEEGRVKNIIDTEMNMISGLDLDAISDVVEDKLTALNEIVYAD